MTLETSEPVVAQSGTFRFADIEVHRLGFGTMRLTGRGIWGQPSNRDEALRVLRRAVELGVDFLDTADSYGPNVAEDIIRDALHPYPAGLVIATKAGLTRQGPNQWSPVGRPEYLRQQCEMSLRCLGVERIDLFQLHRIDPNVAADDQFGVLADLVKEGKVRAVGLSEVSVADLEAAQAVTPIATVQNRYNLTDRAAEDLLDYCEAEGIGFIPWAPIAAGQLAQPGGPVDAIEKETGATASQVSLAWLLARSPVMLPIPGTSSVAHLEDNCGAASLRLTSEQVRSLTDARS
jgi:pyridoxine 4-dehydrogenase